MNTPHTTLYRDKQNAKWMGVCAGVADYTGVNALWIRLATICLIPVLGPLVFMAYFIMGMLLNKRPPHLYQDENEQKYWQGVRQNPQRSAREIRGQFRDIDRRLADVEKYYVSNNLRLSNEIEQLR